MCVVYNFNPLNCFLQESGVNFQFDGTQVAFRGTLTVVSADNLAAWNIGGYKALALAFRKCQYCMVVDEGMQRYNTAAIISLYALFNNNYSLFTPGSLELLPT